jgi:hypothetical protein
MKVHFEQEVAAVCLINVMRQAPIGSGNTMKGPGGQESTVRAVKGKSKPKLHRRIEKKLLEHSVPEEGSKDRKLKDCDVELSLAEVELIQEYLDEWQKCGMDANIMSPSADLDELMESAHKVLSEEEKAKVKEEKKE